MWLQLFIIANYFLKKHRAILSLKWLHLSLWEPERDISVGCCTGSKFAHSLFNLEHISSECPDPSYQVAWTSFDHIINDLNGTKKKRGRWINQGPEMDLLYDLNPRSFWNKIWHFVPWGPVRLADCLFFTGQDDNHRNNFQMGSLSDTCTRLECVSSFVTVGTGLMSL